MFLFLMVFMIFLVVLLVVFDYIEDFGIDVKDVWVIIMQDVLGLMNLFFLFDSYFVFVVF